MNNIMTYGVKRLDIARQAKENDCALSLL